jgi:methyltransferase (TIGR00027 family)
MIERAPSVTAQRVAAYRLAFERITVDYGNPAADDLLTRDVAAIDPGYEGSESMLRYLKARTSFVDRLVVKAIERGTTQLVSIGAGYDGRSLRYAKPGHTWWEVDHPDTQGEKTNRLARLGIDASEVRFVGLDLRNGGLAEALTGSGLVPDATTLFICEGVAVYLEAEVLESLLSEARSLATIGSRLVLTVSTSRSAQGEAAKEGFRRAVAALGEPALSTFEPGQAEALLARSRWRPAPISEKAQRAGFVVGVPVWSPLPSPPPARRTGSLSRLAVYTETMMYRAGIDSLAAHIDAEYGVPVTGTKELDLGVFRVERADGSKRLARVYPPSRDIEAVRADAATLLWLEQEGIPAERCVDDQAVTEHAGQAVLLTEFVPGRHATNSPELYRDLGQLLARIHLLPPPDHLAARPGGAWHHLVVDQGPTEELQVLWELMTAARHRVTSGQMAEYDELLDSLDALRSCHGFAGLPHAFVHPDLVSRNLIRLPDGTARAIDWTGSGWGPRILSLGCMLWTVPTAAGIRSAVSAYRSEVQVADIELEYLEAAIKSRPLVLACWGFATGRQPLTTSAERWQAQEASLHKSAAAALKAFAIPL